MKKESAIISAILPRRCVFCGRVTVLSEGMCADCRASLPLVGRPVCPGCGREKKKCCCRSGMKFYDGVCAPFYFEGNVRHGVHRYKFRGKKPGAVWFGRYIAQRVSEDHNGLGFDIAVSVPLTAKKKKSVPFDHGELIARSAAEELGIPFDGEIIKKIYETDSQHKLGLLLRRGNLAGVFDIPEPEKVRGKRVLLFDDIMTSGETLNECSKMLCLAGAESVHCAVLALTDMKKETDGKEGKKNARR